MRLFIFFVVFIFLFIPMTAQTYQVGHTTLTFNDPDRSGGFGSGGGPGRQIQCEIYYPSETAGEDVVAAPGSFPVIIFGHGFLMPWDACRNIWEHLIPKGYCMVFPRTEGGISPDHGELGEDMALCVAKMQEAGLDDSTPFFGCLSSRSALMGHSMGGGAAFLAAAKQPDVETVIGLAPLETSPSAAEAASSVTVNTLILSGSKDGVTPPSSHHQPIYDQLRFICKFFISITGGAHCYFANPNSQCDLGEWLVSHGISVTREEQQTITFEYLDLWLSGTLYKVSGAISDFNAKMVSDSRITWQKECPGFTTKENIHSGDIAVYPNPARDQLVIENGSEDKTLSISLTDLAGRTVLAWDQASPRETIDIRHVPPGMYILILRSEHFTERFRLMKE